MGKRSTSVAPATLRRNSTAIADIADSDKNIADTHERSGRRVRLRSNVVGRGSFERTVLPYVRPPGLTQGGQDSAVSAADPTTASTEKIQDRNS